MRPSIVMLAMINAPEPCSNVSGTCLKKPLYPTPQTNPQTNSGRGASFEALQHAATLVPPDIGVNAPEPMLLHKHHCDV